MQFLHSRDSAQIQAGAEAAPYAAPLPMSSAESGRRILWIVGVYRAVAERVGPILGFELGRMFAPFGTIYSLELFGELLQIPGLVGLKHSSLDRVQEWQRLELRDRIRPEFNIAAETNLGGGVGNVTNLVTNANNKREIFSLLRDAMGKPKFL